MRHGDDRGTTRRSFYLETIFGHDGEYHVRVKSGSKIVLGPLAIQGPEEPSSEAVVSALVDRLPGDGRNAEADTADGGGE